MVLCADFEPYTQIEDELAALEAEEETNPSSTVRFYLSFSSFPSFLTLFLYYSDLTPPSTNSAPSKLLFLFSSARSSAFPLSFTTRADPSFPSDPSSPNDNRSLHHTESVALDTAFVALQRTVKELEGALEWEEKRTVEAQRKDERCVASSARHFLSPAELK
jgi:hypothetical protein